MIICDSLRLVYIDVPKTASATLDTFFTEKGGVVEKHSQGIKHGRVIPFRAKNYARVASVRNPFERATSYYYFSKERNQTKQSFDDFLDLLLSTKEYASGHTDLKTYIHFPICKYLAPIGYDILLRQENLVEDLKNLGFTDESLLERNKIDRPSWKDSYSKERKEKIILWAEKDFEEFGYNYGP